MSEQSLPNRPEPPKFCARCSVKGKTAKPGEPPPLPMTEWHCPNKQCTWVVCIGCKGITDVAGMIPGRGDQQR